jgi:tRNA A-37 threonylcarbamoyl transferase component Bud32
LTGLTVLARGGYATVYRAVQESVGREVAVKVENRTLENERDQRRFLREARAAGRMSSHPHVVDLFDAGVTSDGHPYLIMELCDGSYAERMKSAPLSPAEAREVGFKIADALADAHSLGVLHRDVKPANILFSRFGEPALADFGLAILAEWRDVSITLDVLTPAYAPPEMFRHAQPSPAADVYALCATLYALVRGKPPRWRDGQAPSLVSLVDMFAEPLPDLPGVPADMMALLRAGMSNDAAARPTAVELRDALQALRLDPAPAVVIPSLGSLPLRTGEQEEETVPQGPTVAGPPASAFGGGPVASGFAGGPTPFSGGGSAAPVSGGGPAPGWPGAGSFGAAPPPVAFVGESAVRPGGWPDSTPHGTPRPPKPNRTLLWASIVAGTLVLASLLALVIYGPELVGRGVAVFKTPVAAGSSSAPTPTTTAKPTATGGPSATASASNCGVAVPGNVTCIRTPECYDTAKKPIGCAGRHTWEAFAFAELPAGVRPADAAQNPQVRQVCSTITLLIVAPHIGLTQWNIDVLVPASGGDRTYRCLAGRGPNALTGPQIARQ